tara:strand:+ start:168 stop:743 length:576 start_codon:yes stop_codon:yes gene_type:complete
LLLIAHLQFFLDAGQSDIRTLKFSFKLCVLTFRLSVPKFINLLIQWKMRRKMTHQRIRPFNTKKTYPEQNLDNDLCQAVVTFGGKTVWIRGQCPQNLDDAKNIESLDPSTQTHKVMQNIRQLIIESGGEMEHLVKLVVYITDIRHREAIYRTMGDYIKGVHPVCTGLVVQALARPEWLVEIDATAVIPGTN